MIAKGADVTVKEEGSQETCLHKATIGNHIDCVKYLVSKNVPIDAKNDEGLTALHLAVINVYLEIVEILIANNADVNAQNNKGLTPLHAAVVENSVKSLQLLLQSKKIDPNVKDVEVRTGNTQFMRMFLENESELCLIRQKSIENEESCYSTFLHFQLIFV